MLIRPQTTSFAKIRVMGIGGGGINALNTMISQNQIQGVDFIAVNTDAQALLLCQSPNKLQIGEGLTKGLGSGGSPEIGKQAAEESYDKIKEIIDGSDMIFLTAGMGGGTGTGGCPIIANAAKEVGALTVAVVTKPFSFEGISRQKIAEAGLKKLKEKTDSLISISNDKLLDILDQNMPISSAFWVCDEILREAVSGISDLILRPGIINVDFADVKAVMKDSGSAIFGVGRAKGEKRAEIAAKAALNSPLLGISPRGAKGVLFNVSGGRDISLVEVEEIGKIITKEINPEAKVIFGAISDEKLNEGELKVTVIATGF